jgi:hypothetical protein
MIALRLKLFSGAGDFGSRASSVPVHISPARFGLNVLAAHVHGKGFDEIIGKPFAAELLSTH